MRVGTEIFVIVFHVCGGNGNATRGAERLHAGSAYGDHHCWDSYREQVKLWRLTTDGGVVESVDIVWSSLSRAWRKAQYEELWLQFRPRGSKDVLEAVEAAVQVANQEVDDAGWGGEVFVEGVYGSDSGPVALMSRAGPEEGVRAWFAAFARVLETSGKSGRVTAAPTAFFPDWLSGVPELPPVLVGFVSYQILDLDLLDRESERRTWHVAPELPAKITDNATRRGRFMGADVYLSRDIHQMRMTNPDVGKALAEGAIKYALAAVTYIGSAPRRLNRTTFGPLGPVTYSVRDKALGWQHKLDKITEASPRQGLTSAT